MLFIWTLDIWTDGHNSTQKQNMGYLTKFLDTQYILYVYCVYRVSSRKNDIFIRSVQRDFLTLFHRVNDPDPVALVGSDFVTISYQKY